MNTTSSLKQLILAIVGIRMMKANKSSIKVFWYEGQREGIFSLMKEVQQEKILMIKGANVLPQNGIPTLSKASEPRSSACSSRRVEVS